MDPTSYILSRGVALQRVEEITPTPPGFTMFNTGGVEVEVAEFLFSLTRLLRPKTIIETGTHLGISSTYLALACQENGVGKVTTCEVIPELKQQAEVLWNRVGVSHLITSLLQPSLSLNSGEATIGLLFLDSEPQYRFDEFIHFWAAVEPGGFIVIHDLHPSMGHHGQTYHGVYDWPYGDFREKLTPYLKGAEVQTVHFPTPRGLTIFQKARPDFEVTKLLKAV